MQPWPDTIPVNAFSLPRECPVFNSISLKGWRQFHSVEIDFHERCTIITGANGTGKTTILGVLNSHYGWPNEHIATLVRRKVRGEEEKLRLLSRNI